MGSLEEGIELAEEVPGIMPIKRPAVVSFPHVCGDRSLATRENLEALMQHAQVNIRYDIIKKRVIVDGVDIDGDENTIIAHLKSLCALHGLSKTVVDEQISAIAKARSFNPITDCLNSLKRSRHNDPIKELVGSLPLQNKKWSEIAFKRWFIQCVAAADAAELSGNKESLPKFESILALYGSQGTKKSSFIRALLPAEIKSYYVDGHLLDLSNKDSILQALQNWITELGELDSTFRKSDISAIKAFTSKQEDVIRRPYARAASTIPRQTSFLGSVNEEKYLRDTTGNRRYLPITVLGELKIPEDFDCEDFWAYVWEQYLLGEQWWLTPEEEEYQRQALSGHQHLDFEELLLDHFDFNAEYRGVMLTGAEILDALHVNNNQGAATRLGNTLKVMGVKRNSSRRYRMPNYRRL